MFKLFILSFYVAVLSGLLVFCSFRSHLLLTLLGLEFMMMGLYGLLYFVLLLCDFSLYFVLVFLTFFVCEGVLGLGILVSLIRSHGSDSISSLSVLVW